MYKQTLSKKIVSLFTIFATVLGFSLINVQFAYAASLSALSDTMSSLKVSTLSSHTIRFTTPTGANQNTDTIIITFPSDFNFTSKTIGTVTFTHGATTGLESTETLAASPSATAWGAVFSGTENRILTLTAPTDGTGAAVLAPADKVVITYDSTNSTNAATPGTYVVDIAGTFGDTGSISVNLIADDTVSVSATVQQAITFTISTSTIYFGNLSAGAAKFASSTNTSGDSTETIAHTLAVSTNAPSGYAITVRGQTLTSQQNALNTIDATGGTAASSSAGTEQFGIRATASGGTGSTIDSTFSGGSTYGYDATATTSVSFASGSGATNTTTYSLRYLANIAGTTEAGTYAASLVYVATANF